MTLSLCNARPSINGWFTWPAEILRKFLTLCLCIYLQDCLCQACQLQWLVYSKLWLHQFKFHFLHSVLCYWICLIQPSKYCFLSIMQISAESQNVAALIVVSIYWPQQWPTICSKTIPFSFFSPIQSKCKGKMVTEISASKELSNLVKSASCVAPKQQWARWNVRFILWQLRCFCARPPKESLRGLQHTQNKASYGLHFVVEELLLRSLTLF